MSSSRVLDRRTVLRGRVFELAVEKVELPGGRHAELEIVRHPGAAAIVPLTDAGEVILVRQYRHAAGDYLWEIPAGTRETAEASLACARRELVEETGYAAADWVDLGVMLPAPGYTTERIDLFLARGLSLAEQKLDWDELIVGVEAVPVRRALAWIADGTLVDGKTVVALCRARERGLLGGGRLP